MTEQHVLSPAAEALASAFAGQLVRPGDPDYDEARAVWNGMFDRRPAAICRCRETADVVAAVRLARAAGLPVAVRGGGHSAAGFGTCDDGLVIDLSPMKRIEVDPAARIARADAGLTWGEFDAATQAHGLGVTGGRFSTTGIAGLTLGSGSGWAERRCGLTADNLLAAEVVTADGSVVQASPDENAELFWGLRGGGGNFGIVTSFTLALHEFGPLIYGGMLICLPDRAGDVLRTVREVMPTAPDDLGLGVAFVSAPPEPFVPAEMHFQPIVALVICWTGDMEEGERVLAPIREAVQPVMDMVQPMPYTALQSMLDAGGPKGVKAYMKAELLESLDDDVCAALIRQGARRPGPLDQIIIEPLGGAIARTGEGETALGRRDAQWCYHALALWTEDDEASADAQMGWARGLADDLRPYTTPGVYLNFTSDGGEQRVRSTYGEEKYARLQALKDRYDPENVFRLNQNIRPSRG